MFKLFKKNMEKSQKTREKIINDFIEEFLYDFHHSCERKNLDVPELPDDVIISIVNEYFNKKSLTEANKYIYNALDKYVEDTYEKINWNLGREEVKETFEYKAWMRHSEIDTIWSDCKRMNGIEKTWVNLNGQVHTDEEAATIAADKWCELIFGWHLQDNGAINEDHAGGFYACALGTVLANDSKQGISDEVKEKAHGYFKDYYLHSIHYDKSDGVKDIEWANKMFPDDEEGDHKFDWKYGFGYLGLSCDYGPSTPLYLILVHAGVPKRDAGNICPWKTSISIRSLDNAVQYHTYRHMDEL